jgi:hypothetical protein
MDFSIKNLFRPHILIKSPYPFIHHPVSRTTFFPDLISTWIGEQEKSIKSLPGTACTQMGLFDQI